MAGTHNPLLPEMATVIETVQETHNIKTFRVRFDDEEKMKNFTFQPGQVGQLSVFGVGESTFVINSSPTRMDYLQFSVMKAGENTAALHKLNAGDKIGVRAPLGNWFPYNEWKGKNIFFIGGGIGMAPIRTIMVYLLDKRKDYGDISLLYGAKTPTGHRPSSPTCPNGWNARTWNVHPDHRQPRRRLGTQGRPHPNVLKEIGPKPDNTIAVLCGPPIMIKFTYSRGPRRTGLPGRPDIHHAGKTHEVRHRHLRTLQHRRASSSVWTAPSSSTSSLRNFPRAVR